MPILKKLFPRRWICGQCGKITRAIVHGTCATCAEKRAEEALRAQLHRASELSRMLIQLNRAASAVALMLHELAHDPALNLAMGKTYPAGSPECSRLFADLVQAPNPEGFWRDTKALLLAPVA